MIIAYILKRTAITLMALVAFYTSYPFLATVLFTGLHMAGMSSETMMAIDSVMWVFMLVLFLAAGLFVSGRLVKRKVCVR